MGVEGVQKGVEGVSDIIPIIIEWFTDINAFQKFCLFMIVILIMLVYHSFKEWEKMENKTND